MGQLLALARAAGDDAGTRALARTVLRALFNGDPDAWTRHRGKHATFAAFMRGSPVSASALARAIDVEARAAGIPEAVQLGLSYSHLRILVAVRDPELRDALARRAAAEGWSERRLRDERRALAGSGKPRRGHPFEATVVRAERQIGVALASIDEGDLEHMADWDIDARQQLVGRLRQHAERLARLIERLGSSGA